jgi:hypothetical protein
MQAPDHKSEIIELENQLRQYEKLLDESFAKNQVLAETKIIFHELKKISEKLIELKKSKE